MNQETHTESSETVRAIWNKDLTLKIVLGEDIDQEETSCRCTDCDAWAWPKFAGPIVVSGDGPVQFCEDCVREIDPDFVDAYEVVFSETRGVAPDQWMEEMAGFFSFLGKGIIERGPCPVDR